MSITVIIPVRGNAPYLDQSLESVFKSNFEPNEILLIDDGIEPKTIELIKKYKNRISLIKSSGRGIVHALNTGISNSKGKYIARLDSDDMMHEDRLGIQHGVLEDDSSLVVLGSQVSYIDTHSKMIGQSKYPTGHLNNHINFTSKCLIAHPSTTIRKSALLEIGGYRDVVKIGDTSLCEDFDLWRRISKLGKLSNLKQSLTFYRQHNLQVSSINFLPNEVATQIVASGFSDIYGQVVYIDPISRNIEQEEIQKILSVQSLPNTLVFKLRYHLMIGKKNNLFTNFYTEIEKIFLRILLRILR
jgi:glycosyltransferase involved in cell wall biosynthesis